MTIWMNTTPELEHVYLYQHTSSNFGVTLGLLNGFCLGSLGSGHRSANCPALRNSKSVLVVQPSSLSGDPFAFGQQVAFASKLVKWE